MIILDLDNCIADDRHRLTLINWDKSGDERWGAYHKACIADRCAISNDLRFDLLHHPAVILTGRPQYVRAQTELWLKRHDVRYVELIMRNPGDHRASTLLKGQMVDWLLNIYGYRLNDFQHAYDDRQDIVDVYRSKGLPASRLYIEEDHRNI